ncbi:MAG: hypothetical protein LBP59_10695 [Planctomycetaceae bacterium]|jgi:hypothetical protein|nr:hypothetical protein [Planctomycetaceae bacterium]
MGYIKSKSVYSRLASCLNEVVGYWNYHRLFYDYLKAWVISGVPPASDTDFWATVDGDDDAASIACVAAKIDDNVRNYLISIPGNREQKYEYINQKIAERNNATLESCFTVDDLQLDFARQYLSVTFSETFEPVRKFISEYEDATTRLLNDMYASIFLAAADLIVKQLEMELIEECETDGADTSKTYKYADLEITLVKKNNENYVASVHCDDMQEIAFETAAGCLALYVLANTDELNNTLMSYFAGNDLMLQDGAAARKAINLLVAFGII